MTQLNMNISKNVLNLYEFALEDAYEKPDKKLPVSYK